MSLRVIVLCALSFLVGCAMTTIVRVPFSLVMLFGFATAMCSSFFIFYRSKVFALIAVGSLFLMLGIVRGYVSHSSIATVDQNFFSQTIVEGTVMSDPDIRETRQQVIVETEFQNRSYRVIVSLPLYPVVVFGDTLALSGEVKRPEPFETESGNEFRYDKYLAKSNIVAELKNAHLLSQEHSQQILDRIFVALFSIKPYFLSLLERTFSEPYAALAGGLLLGAKQGLGETLTNIFNATGLSHIVVLSGYNIMLVALVVVALVQKLPRRFHFPVAVFIMFLFVLIAGAGSASVRAGLMAVIALYGRVSHKTYDALRALIIVTVAMVVWNPFTLVYDIGFQLSVVATGGLLLLTPLVSRRLLWIQHSFVRELVASSVSAYIAVLPLIVYLTGFVSFVSIPANILVLPAVPIAMLASFIIALIAIVAPVFAVALASIAVAPLAWIVFVAQTLFTTGIAGVSVTSVSILMPIIAYAIMGIVYFFDKKKLLHARLDDAPIGVR